MSDLKEDFDCERRLSVRLVVSATVDFLIRTVESEAVSLPVIPDELKVQARTAAHLKVDLRTVLRGYLVGYALFNDLMIRQADEVGGSVGPTLSSIFSAQSASLERLISTVVAEYNSAQEVQAMPADQRQLKIVCELLTGKRLDPGSLTYSFDRFHMGGIVRGPISSDSIRHLGHSLGGEVLIVRPDDELNWFWISRRRPLAHHEVDRQAAIGWQRGVPLALGEWSAGLRGWKRTHHQALAGLPLALADPGGIVRYGSMPLLLAMASDELLAATLRELYIEPLRQERDGGKTLRETLRAYFEAERNVSSAAVALGVKRHTVTNRLRTAELYFGQSLATCAAEVDVALRFERLAPGGLDAEHV
jgi:PucR C-terminal helix-turn-helix domain